MRTVLLRLISNTRLTFAWYGHLKCRHFKEAFRRNCAASVGCMVAAVPFAFRF